MTFPMSFQRSLAQLQHYHYFHQGSFLYGNIHDLYPLEKHLVAAVTTAVSRHRHLSPGDKIVPRCSRALLEVTTSAFQDILCVCVLPP